MKRNFLLFAGALVFAAGCSTKVDLNTEWRDTTIIYGLLDQKDEYHYIRINKAFLGEGDYYAYALIRDSSEYASVNARVEELSGGVVINTYTLRDTELVNKSTDGVFYSPEQTVYYFKKNALNPSSTYRLVANINEGTPVAKEVSAETQLVANFTASAPSSISTGTYDGIDHNYLTPKISFTPPSNSNAFEILWRLKWDEYTATDTIRKHYEWLVGSIGIEAMLSTGLIEYEVNGEAFYKTIANIIPNDPSVTKRVFRAIDVIVYAASEDLETYINVNAPQTGLVQERPEFTNVSNGLGLFSSRVHITVPNKYLTLGSMRELVHGTYTGDLLFCTDTTSTLFTLALPPTVICP
jgi:Domain of unknown function (DUF4249)